MSRLLAIDTASALCSAALLVDGELRWREHATAREHARLLLPMIRALLDEAGCAMTDLDAIAFGRGPGSFTGLRVAGAVAQGLALGAGLPVVPVSDLRALALQGLEALPDCATPGLVACCMDARMGEVYAAAFECRPGELPGEAEEGVMPPSAFRPAGRAVLGIGRGFEAWPAELAPVLAPGAPVLGTAEPRAREIARLAAAEVAAGRVLDPGDALPRYLRDNVAHPGPA